MTPVIPIKSDNFLCRVPAQALKHPVAVNEKGLTYRIGLVESYYHLLRRPAGVHQDFVYRAIVHKTISSVVNGVPATTTIAVIGHVLLR